MIPAFDKATGNLPPGIPDASWDEIVHRYGHNATRPRQLQGLRLALDELASAGCSTVDLVTTRKVRRVADLPEALIEARIACHLTQKQLAEQMGMAEQQIQRYEQQRYGKTSLDRLAQIADVLGVDLGAEVRFAKPVARRAAAGAGRR